MITLFSFHANWCDFVDFCKIVIIFSISVILRPQRRSGEVSNCYTCVVTGSQIIVLDENDNNGFVQGKGIVECSPSQNVSEWNLERYRGNVRHSFGWLANGANHEHIIQN